MKRIVGLKVGTAYRDLLDNREKWLPGFGVYNNRFPISKQINFTLSIQNGDIEHYVMELNGQPLRNSSESVISYETRKVSQMMHAIKN